MIWAVDLQVNAPQIRIAESGEGFKLKVTMRFIPKSEIRNPQLVMVPLLLCLLPALFAQGSFTPYTIEGRVSLPDSKPAARALVKITNRLGYDREVYADDAGRYEFSELRRGTYYLTAVNEAAPEQVVDPVKVELSLSSPYTVSANIYLKNKDTKAAPQEKQAAFVTVAEERQDAPKPARKAFEQAMNLRSEQKYDDSLKKFTRSIELFPSYFQALAERGHLLLTMGRMPEAIKDFQRALELNANYGPALRGLGLGKFQQNKYAEAVQDLERAADLEPGNATVYYFKGIAEVALDRREPARASLEKALSIDPVSSVRAHVHLATLCIREHHPEEAIQELELYLKAVPNPPDKQKLDAILSQLRAGPKPR
jgi:tetratricopeptide (TPR) repeat protein